MVELGSGYFTLYINATGVSGTSVQLVNESFTVQDFNPGLSVKKTPGYYFSFYGNSPNSSLGISVTSNVSSRFWVNETGFAGSAEIYSCNGTYLNLTINRTFGLFRGNGRYEIGITAEEKSGRTTTHLFNISVNNTIPVLNTANSTLYFNESLARIPISFENSTTYWYSLNGNYQNKTTMASPFIQLENLSTEIVLEARTLWGNSNSTDLQLIYSREAPGISFSVSQSQLIYTRNFTISYSIADPVKLSRVTLIVNNDSELLGNATSGKFNYAVNSDGFFNLSLDAADLCGNGNSSGKVEVSSHYFPEIESISPEISVFMGIAHLNALLKGNNLESVNLTWTLGGKQIGTGKSAWTFIMPGSHTIVLVLHYHSKTISVDKRVFTMGFIPELFGVIALSSVVIYRKYSGRPDGQMSKELILKNLGKSRKELYKRGRKTGIRASTISETISEMQKSNQIALLKDPNGVDYVMDPHSADE